MQPLDIAVLRGQFPALNQLVDGKTPIFFDGPGGAQVPHSVLSAMTDYLGHFNANLGGAFFLGPSHGAAGTASQRGCGYLTWG